MCACEFCEVTSLLTVLLLELHGYEVHQTSPMGTFFTQNILSFSAQRPIMCWKDRHESLSCKISEDATTGSTFLLFIHVNFLTIASHFSCYFCYLSSSFPVYFNQNWDFFKLFTRSIQKLWLFTLYMEWRGWTLKSIRKENLTSVCLGSTLHPICWKCSTYCDLEKK